MKAKKPEENIPMQLWLFLGYRGDKSAVLQKVKELKPIGDTKQFETLGEPNWFGRSKYTRKMSVGMIYNIPTDEKNSIYLGKMLWYDNFKNDELVARWEVEHELCLQQKEIKKLEQKVKEDTGLNGLMKGIGHLYNMASPKERRSIEALVLHFIRHH